MNSYFGTFVAALALGASGTASALPFLQLDFNGGLYVGGSDETTYCVADDCELFALLTPADQKPNQSAADYGAYIEAIFSDTYYISIALVPKTETSADLGSFDVNSKTVSVTSDMIYGTPPVESFLATTDPNDLSSHGIFETFFYELAFNFDAANTLTPYNAQDDATVDPGDQTSGIGGYYASFGLDTTKLDPSVSLHFDLYNSAVFDLKGSIDANEIIGIDDFAPFSKDAQITASPLDPPPAVPEPSILASFGLSLFGLGLLRRRYKNA